MIDYVEQILLQRQTDTASEVTKQIEMINDICGKYAIKHSLKQSAKNEKLRQRLNLYVDSNVFDNDTKKDLDEVIEELW